MQFGTGHLGHFTLTGSARTGSPSWPTSWSPLRAVSDRVAPLLTQSAAMGAPPTLRAATDPAVLGGQYYGPGGRGEVRGHPRLVTSSPDSYDLAVQRRLWAVSEELTGVEFPL